MTQTNLQQAYENIKAREQSLNHQINMISAKLEEVRSIRLNLETLVNKEVTRNGN